MLLQWQRFFHYGDIDEKERENGNKNGILPTYYAYHVLEDVMMISVGRATTCSVELADY